MNMYTLEVISSPGKHLPAPPPPFKQTTLRLLNKLPRHINCQFCPVKNVKSWAINQMQTKQYWLPAGRVL